jgi:tetratricopeptide (TPR) repeat protein
VTRALEAFQARRYAAALPLLEAARVARPADLSVLLLLGVSYARLGLAERAEPLLRAVAARAEPEDQAAARVFLSIIYRDQGASDRAQLELDKATAQSRSLGPSVLGLLQGMQPHLLYGSVLIATEFDGNVPLTNLATWRTDPGKSSDGDLLLIGSLTVRPSKRIGLYFSDTISYRQQFQLQDYNLLLNTTTAGYGYFGARHRVRLAAALTPALLGGSILYVDASWRAAYRVAIVDKLGAAISYDGRYRDYLRADYDALTGSTQTIQTELSWGVAPEPVSVGIGFQVVRDELVAGAPITTPDGTLTANDFRAWAFGPTLRLRARLHRRVELALSATLLRRRFDYILPSGEQRFDWEASTDLSVNVAVTRWLDVFVGTLNLYNESTDGNYSYYKPNVYLGVYGHFAAR